MQHDVRKWMGHHLWCTNEKTQYIMIWEASPFMPSYDPFSLMVFPRFLHRLLSHFAAQHRLFSRIWLLCLCDTIPKRRFRTICLVIPGTPSSHETGKWEWEWAERRERMRHIFFEQNFLLPLLCSMKSLHPPPKYSAVRVLERSGKQKGSGKREGEKKLVTVRVIGFSALEEEKNIPSLGCHPFILEEKKRLS